VTTPISDQTVLITGATDGLGRALAEELARGGATVLVHGRDRDRIAGVKCARLMKNRLRCQAWADQSDRAFRSRISDARPRSS